MHVVNVSHSSQKLHKKSFCFALFLGILGLYYFAPSFFYPILLPLMNSMDDYTLCHAYFMESIVTLWEHCVETLCEHYGTWEA